MKIKTREKLMITKQKRYAVIICKHCKKPKIAETKQKTTMCPHCGKTLQLSKTPFVFETNSISDAQQIIGQINASKDDHLDQFRTFLKNSH